MEAQFIVSSPGRADFLNTHQDYKGLPVVPVAINLRLYISAKLSGDKTFNVRSVDLERLGEPCMDSFDVGVNDMLGGRFFGNYLRGVVNVLVKKGFGDKIRGMDLTVRSEIPIGSGLASSAALEVAFTELLNHAFNLGLSRKDVAEISFAAENVEVGIPCGRLDQYGSAFGGIIKLDCRPPYDVEPLPFRDLTFAIIDSGIRHSTGEIHPRRQMEINAGLETLMKSNAVPRELKAKLGYRFDQPRWEDIGEEEIQDYLSILSEPSRKRILFTLRMHRLTMVALRVLRFEGVTAEDLISNLGEESWRRVQKGPSEEFSYRILGEIMNAQHALLRDLYDVSLPEIDHICDAALNAGAYGAKLSGAGMGGSIIALVKNREIGERVIDACLSEGARGGWVSEVGEGVRIEKTTKI
ncbi:MAG: galactokinase family protein [Candidatus Bathyarchaeia archaeon]|nr:GHMP kinase [Candidatus Bathyarchaeota archaeon]